MLPLNVSGMMQYANDPDVNAFNQVEDDEGMRARPASQTTGDFTPLPPQQGLAGQPSSLAIDCVEQAVRRDWVLLREMKPSLEEVGLRTARVPGFSHPFALSAAEPRAPWP